MNRWIFWADANSKGKVSDKWLNECSKGHCSYNEDLERRFGDNICRHPLHDAIGLEDLVVVYVNCCYSYVMLNNYASSDNESMMGLIKLQNAPPCKETTIA